MKKLTLITVTTVGVSSLWTCPVYALVDKKAIYFLAEISSEHMRNIWLYPQIKISLKTSTHPINIVGEADVIDTGSTRQTQQIYEELYEVNTSVDKSAKESNMEWKLIKIDVQRAIKSPVVSNALPTYN